MYTLQYLFILVAIASICTGQPEDRCDVVPKDLYIEAGSDAEIVCKTSCVRGKISWTLNNRRVDESLSKTVNSSDTVLTLRNFTHRKALLQCHRADTNHVLGGTILRTYTKPGNISCLLYHEPNGTGLPQLLKCTWEHQIYSSMDVTYSVMCASCRKEICKSHVTMSCTGKVSSDVIFLGDKFPITVRAKTAAWESISNSIEFNPYHILKMLPPTFEVSATLPGQLLVSWSRSITLRKCHCQVQYSQANKGTLKWVINKTLDSREKGEVTIEKVESCSKYTVAVRCALENAPWSDWSHNKTVVTKLHKGDVQLRLWRKVTEPNEKGTRKVHAMWMGIPSTCPGTYTYTIKLTPDEEHRSGESYTNSTCGNSSCNMDVNENAHRLNLTVFQNDALLMEDSVYVPATGESTLQVTDILTSTLEGVILVRWTGPVQPVSGYMVDYTNGNQYYWKQINYTNATLFGLLDMKPYNITVTPLFGDKTGHGKQAFQICSRVGGPGNITIDVQTYDKRASVSWTVSQKACSGVVVNYTVFYFTPEGPQLNVTVEGTKQDLKDLKPDAQYSVYVVATALTGSTNSSVLSFRTKRFDSNHVTSLSIYGGIAIIIFLCFGICCANELKKFKEKPVPNPGLSSVAMWPQKMNAKIKEFGEMGELGVAARSFSNPAKSLCERVYTEETQQTSTTSLAAGGNGNPSADPGPSPDLQNEEPPEPGNTWQPDIPGESTTLLSSDSGPLSPYRSQSSAETPPVGRMKQGKRLLVKQQERTTPSTVYVTIAMFTSKTDES